MGQNKSANINTKVKNKNSEIRALQEHHLAMPFLLKIFITNNFIGRKKGRKVKGGRKRQIHQYAKYISFCWGCRSLKKY